MPELPEVETIKLGLQKHVVGRKIIGVDVLFPKILSGDLNNVIGATVKDIRRFGKGLVVDLDNNFSIAVHVKMTGQLVYGKFPVVFPKHTHVVFRLNDAGEAYLYYNDVRRFGWIKILKTEDVAELPFFKSLGLEPLKNLTGDKFRIVLRGNRMPIKSLIMDQQKIAGIGNIYACDALYMAGIHPERPALSLTDAEASGLFVAIEDVLRKSIAVGGASASNYVNALGEKGSYQDHFLVYKKEGEVCRNCSSLILRIKTGGRSTFFCPECQK
jgi:formamidopyrimidine-DNA glycosylase